MTLVSILIPAYHAGAFMEMALEGVRMQTHARWEVVVVEDGSRDETEAVVERFAASVKQSVRYERSPENRGVSATRNRAMALARGEVFAFLDADDQWMPSHLEDGLTALEEGADMSFSGFDVYDATADRLLSPPIPNVAVMANPAALLFACNFIQTSSLVMLRAATARKTGEFDPQLAVGEDCDYWIRIMTGGGKLVCTGKCTCIYTKHGDSAMAATLRVAEHSVRFFRKHFDDETLPLALRRKFFADSLVTYGRLVAHTDARLARSLFLEAWRLRPWDLCCGVCAARTFFL